MACPPVTFGQPTGGSTLWIFKSGATHHMIFDHSVLTYYSSVSNFTYIYTANGVPLAVTQSGNIILTFNPSGRITLSSVFCTPELTMQLLTVGKIIDCNCNILFTPTSCIVQDHTGRKIGTGRKVNDLH